MCPLVSVVSLFALVNKSYQQRNGCVHKMTNMFLHTVQQTQMVAWLSYYIENFLLINNFCNTARLHSSISGWETGFFNVNTHDCGWGRTVCTLRLEEMVLHMVAGTHATSTYQGGHAMHESHMAIWQVMHQQHPQPYHQQKSLGNGSSRLPQAIKVEAVASLMLYRGALVHQHCALHWLNILYSKNNYQQP